MKQLVSDILAYSQARVADTTFEAITPRTLLDHAMRLVGIDSDVVQLDVQGQGIVWGSLPQLGVVLSNLLSNARKYAHPERELRVRVSVREDAEGCEWEIADNGIGIDMKYAHRIFELFQRLHTRSEYPGTGIGLALCASIVERHGGSIALKASDASGSIFTFRLPSPGASGHAGAER